MPTEQAMVDAGEHLHHYSSAVDDSRQPFSFYMPRRWRARYPVVVCLHGFGGRMTAFSPPMRSFADFHGWLLLSPDGRGNQHFDGLGEDDVLAALAALGDMVPLDEERITVHGGSMGGHGALRLALRHPHLFAGVSAVAGWISAEQWYAKWYAAPWAPDASGEWTPHAALARLADAASPWAWREHARWVRGRLAFGTADDVNEPEDAEWLLAWLREEGLYGPRAWCAERVAGGGHGAGGHWPDVARFLAACRRTWPRTIRSPTLRHADAGWVRADRLIDVRKPARLGLSWRLGHAEVTTDNIAELAVTPRRGPREMRERRVAPLHLIVDGQRQGVVDAGETHVLELASRPGRFVKRRGVDGPIGELFRAPFQVVRPVSGPDREAAERFCADWDAWFVRRREERTGPLLRPIPAEAATDATHHLVLFGDASNNPLLRRIASWPGTLGWRPLEDGLRLGEREFRGPRLGWWALHPTPWRPDGLVLWCRGYQHSAIDPEVWPEAVGKDLESLPWRWPDVVVWDEDAPCRESVQPPLRCLTDAWRFAATLDAGWRLNGVGC
jgi:pimeloyl-ACP methyl ester carboxylesterase